jgi:iron complex outermembrane receptor protein
MSVKSVKSRWLLSGSIVSLGLALPLCTQVLAQSSDTIDVVTVTASKFGATDIEKTPITMTAVSGATLTDRAVTNALELTSQVPGLVVDPGSSSPTVTIRGVGQDQFNIEAENSVAVYVDGVYVSRNPGDLLPFNDLQQVEVLKGPQAATYGRNATGGAILYTTVLPEAGFDSEVSAGYSSFDGRNGYASFNDGTDELAGRVSVYYTADDGFVKNIFRDTEQDGMNAAGMRASILFQPTSNLQIVARANYDTDFTSYSAQGLIGGNGAGGLFGGTAIQYDQHVWETNQDFPTPERNTRDLTASLTADLDLGWVKIKSISAYSWLRYIDKNEYDQTNVPYLNADLADEDSLQLTQELQLNGDIGRLHWLGGGFYLHENASEILDVDFATQLLGPLGALSDNNNFQTTTSAAGFAALKYDITDHIRLDGGIRYTDDQKLVTGIHAVTTGGSTFDTCDNSFSKSWGSTTYDVGADADISDNSLGYAKYSHGFKAGGFGSQGCPNPYNPESINAYEVGFKNKFFGDQLVLNVAGFYYDYSDMQVTSITLIPGTTITVSDIENAAKSTVYGLDTDFKDIITQHLTADGGFTWLPQANYQSFTTYDPYVAAFAQFGVPEPAVLAAHGTPIGGGYYNLAGNRLNRAPDFNGIFGLQYADDLPMMSGWNYTIRGELNYISSQQYSPFNRAASLEPGRLLVNANLTLASQNGLSVRAYVKNLFNKFYAADRYDNATILAEPYEYGRPREGGIELVYDFQ